MIAIAAIAALAVAAGGPRLTDVRVSNGNTPFAGDGPLLTTISPNGDGFRDRAIVRFRLDRPARVRMEAVRTDTIRPGRPAVEAIWSREVRLPRGPHTLVWRPPSTTPARTYVLRLVATDRLGRRSVYDNPRPGTGRHRAPVVRVQSVEAGFTRRSYAPGEVAELRIASDARTLRIQVFTFGNQTHPTPQDLQTSGVAMTPAVRVDWTPHRRAPARLRVVRAGGWASGLYFLRLTSGDGRVGYAPLIVRPRRLGTSRVAVVLSTNTWQAYNFADEDGDGWGDSWYVSDDQRRVDLERPYLDFGVPFRFRDWDLTFVAWLNRTGKGVDYLSDDDLEHTSAAELAAAYDLIVFPGHAEYVTAHAYDVVQGFRDRGGNLMFLSANNFFWRVQRDGRWLVKTRLWRDLGRPEAGLVGVQYVGSDGGRRQAGYTVTGTGAAPWAFAGTGLRDGDVFGTYGIEIDARTPASPSETQLLAAIPELMGPGRSAEMTYYETASGAKVFAAGALNFAASLDRPEVQRLVENVWSRLSRP
jgi:N,N-dimethylformamidase beta subunit-like, C-terminal